MIEKIILDHLAEKLAVPIFMEVQSYAGSLLEAAQLNDQVKQAMDSLPELADIGAARLNSDYNFTDTASKRYRYQAVYDVTHYERR